MQPRDLSAHVPYSAGRGVEEVARELDRDPESFVKLASNENALGPAPAAVSAIRDSAGSVHRYPTSAHVDLTGAIAERWSVDPAQIWLANGGDGALDYLARAMLEPGDRVLVPRPGFAYYAMSARYHHGSVGAYALDAEDGFRMDPETVLEAYDGERIIYLTSPHNPTGMTMSPDGVRKIATDTADRTLVVVDEAYGEYAETDSAVPLVESREDIAVLRTFSKAYGLAGLRLGFAVVPGEWADAYAKVNTPFAASEIACRAGLAALTDDAHVQESIETVAWGREHFEEAMGGRTYPSEGNFVLFDVADVPSGEEETPAARVAADSLERGLIVRDCTSFGLPGCIRVTCGTREETRTASHVLQEVLPG